MKMLLNFALVIFLGSNAICSSPDIANNPNETVSTPSSERIRVQGRVINNQTMQPISNISLVFVGKWEESVQHGETDSNGDFVFYMPSDKVYEIYISDNEYVSENYLVSSRGRKTGTILFKMTAQTKNIN